MPDCTRCGAPISSSDNYCARCGEQQKEVRISSTAKVAGSGSVVQDNSVGAGELGVAIGHDAYGPVVIAEHGATVHIEEERSTGQAMLLRAAYLNYLFETTSTLSLPGVDLKFASQSETHLKLNAVYTALLTISTDESGHLDSLDLQRFDQTYEVSAVEQLNQHSHLVLLGDPGSGKSTFVDFVTLCLSGELVGRTDVNLMTLISPLPDNKGKDQTEYQVWEHGALLPVRVILRDFAAYGLPISEQPARAKDLWYFIVDELAKAALSDYAPYLYRELQKEGGILLLDGMDEVPVVDHRRIQIIEAIEDFVKSFPRCRVLVTSRIYAYQQQDWRLSGFSEAILVPFKDGQIYRFLEYWYSHISTLRGLHRDEAQRQVELLKQAILTDYRLKELATHPLLLTLIASLHTWRGGSLPNRREELYAEAVDLLLDWWESPKNIRSVDGKTNFYQPSLAEWLKVDREKVRTLLNQLAFEAHSEQTDLLSTADISEEKLVMGLMQLKQNPDVKPGRLIEYLSQRAGLLLPRGVGVYSFPHRTFQEYLAACYLTDRDFPAMVARLTLEDPNRWREVALLAGAKAARGTMSAAWRLVEYLCHQEPNDVINDSKDVWGAFIAGQVLQENIDLASLEEWDRPRVARVQQWLVRILEQGELPTTERVTIGGILSHLGDPRFCEDIWYLPNEPLLGFIPVPSGSFLMGTREEEVPALLERFGGERDWYKWEIPQHKIDLPTFYIARHPVTQNQYFAFTQATNHVLPKSYLGQQADRPFEWYSGRPPTYLQNHPVVLVSWYDAVAYCQWLTMVLQEWDELPLTLAKLIREKGWVVRLPTEPEWEKAARGSLEDSCPGRRFPWGNDPSTDKANYRATGIGIACAVGCFPDGASQYGCLDMSGNVWEWVYNLLGKYPYDSTDGREDPLASGDRVMRGGACGSDVRWTFCTSRDWFDPEFRLRNRGFRVVIAPDLC